MNNKKPDLQQLVTAARDGAAHTKTIPHSSRPKKYRTGLWALSVGGVFFATILFGNSHMAGLGWVLDQLSPSRVTQRAQSDLELILSHARDTLKDARNSDGSLPEILPNAAFAAVVSYHHDGASYELSASAHGVTVTLDSDGIYSFHYKSN